ncbi:P-loop containing nucleoside triphosphate hydrolase protein [Chytriomyces sp. MP71]|nr:P-loop containing nucleoside triphosphate hydrolase protein [Chytriomyces sp. MP71]
MIEFSDNQPCIELIQGRLGIMALLDEDSRLPSGSDATFIAKLNKNFDIPSQKFYAKPRFGTTDFIVRHYAVGVTNAGYPNKLEYEQFAARYDILVSSDFWEMPDKKALCIKIVTSVLADPSKYHVGKTKVFLKSGQKNIKKSQFADALPGSSWNKWTLRLQAKDVEKVKERTVGLEAKVVSLSQALREKTLEAMEMAEKSSSYEATVQSLKEKLEASDNKFKSAAADLLALKKQLTQLKLERDVIRAEKERFASIVDQAMLQPL